MPEKAKKKRSKKERARILRRVFLGGAIGLLIVAIAWFAFQRISKISTQPEIDIIEDTLSQGVYCDVLQCFLINADGVAFKETSRPKGNLLLVIENPHRTNIALTDVVMEPVIIAELLFLRNTLAEEFNVRLGRATQSRFNEEDFDVETSEGWRVRISTTNNAYATAQILAQTLEKIGEDRALLEYIDLRIENRVYYKTL